MSDDTLKAIPPKRNRQKKKTPVSAPIDTGGGVVVKEGDIGELPRIVSKTTTPRQTLPTNANILGSFPYAFLPRRQYQSVDLSSVNVSTLSPQQLIDLLSDADPDVSLAMWNFLMLVCGEWQVDARTYTDEEDPVASDAVNNILNGINTKWGGFQNLLYQWTMSVLLEGACSGETIPSDDLKDVHDIVPVTPWTIYFQRDANQDLIVYQWQPMIANGMVNNFEQPPDIASIANHTYGAAGFRLMNTATFGYVPYMPMVDDPYGRMPFASVFQIIILDNQLLQDLRRWAHINAWGRIDVSIIQDMVQKLMPPAVQANRKDLITFINTYISDVAKEYNNLNPDDTFIHLDNVKVGSVDSSGKTMQVDNLIKAIERKKFRSLRMLPILMGSNEGTTETHGTVQWEIMVRSIESMQTCVATLANTLLTVALRLKGISAHAVLSFESVRSTDRLLDAQTESLEIKNAATKRDEGWITQDEASIAITGSKAVAEPPEPDALIAPLMESPRSDGTIPPPVQPVQPQQKTAKPKEPESEDTTNDDEPVATTKSRIRFFNSSHLRSESERTTAMTAYKLPATIAHQIAIPDGEPVDDLHMTLTFHSNAPISEDERSAFQRVVKSVADSHDPLTGEISGIGRFTSVSDGSKTPLYASVDMPGLPEFRHDLVTSLNDAGFAVNAEHGYTPHITLAYLDKDDPTPSVDISAVKLPFTALTLALGDELHTYPLGKKPANPQKSRSVVYPVVITATPPEPRIEDMFEDDQRAVPSKNHRASYQERFKRDIGTHLQKLSIPHAALTHILSTLTSTDRSLDDHTRDAAKDDQVAQVASMLQEIVPDNDPDLANLLNKYQWEGWDLAAQEAIDAIGVSGNFYLTNSDIMDRLKTYVQDRAEQLQTTTRNQIANAIVSGSNNGDSDIIIAGAIVTLIAGMGDTRADNIASYETSRTWGDASVTAWSKNGIPQKVWRTDDDPDPGAGRGDATPCRDNAYGSPVGIDEAFPSGDLYPPAHNWCACSIIPSGDRADNAEDWLGE